MSKKSGRLRKDQVTESGNVTTLHIKVDHTKVARGHQPHITGAGVHKDKRTKRQRTRAASFRAAVSYN